MASGEYSREHLLKLQDELAQYDPTALEMDLDDPDTVLSLILTAALLKGSKIILGRVDDHGRTETISIFGVEEDAGGEPVTEFTFSSSDGTFAPDMAEMVAEVMLPELEAEIRSAAEQ